MNIYFSCSITGGRQDQPVYQAMVEHMLFLGHEVPTALLAGLNISTVEAAVPSVDVFLRDDAWVRACDALVAEVSTPSHGVGYEIALALCLEKPVLCCYREGHQVSKMILGNTSQSIQVKCYRTVKEAVEFVDYFLACLH